MIYRNERISRLQDFMKTTGIDMAAITTRPNLHYFAGFVPHLDERFSALLISPNFTLWVAPALNIKEISEHTSIELIDWSDEQGANHAIQKAMQKIGKVRVLAMDGGSRADALLQLQQAVTPETCTTTDDLIASLRQLKNEDEITLLAAAAAQADQAMHTAINTCAIGVTEMEIAWAAEAYFRTHGAEMVDFTIVASGENGAFPHHHSSERKLQHGDAVVIDIGATLNGYKSDITRMVFLGKPNEEFIHAYNSVLHANQNARLAVKPGITAAEIDQEARKTLEQVGLGKFFIHRTGHGIGLDGHERPWIMSGNSTPLQVGMTFSIEPGVYLPHKFGIRIEDIVVVTESGSQNLTQYSHELVIKS